MRVSSQDFEHQGYIPKQFSCDGENISPQLEWEDLPGIANCLIIILDDPDSASGCWTHWIVCNIPVNINSLPRNISNEDLQKWGAKTIKNDFGNPYYQGPCPRKGPAHHYDFHLYALDKKLDIMTESKRKDVDELMQSHIVGSAELIGLFARD
jgi:Raf kinase inhibitor-like YbhB/YbcL family protein